MFALFFPPLPPRLLLGGAFELPPPDAEENEGALFADCGCVL